MTPKVIIISLISNSPDSSRERWFIPQRMSVFPPDIRPEGRGERGHIWDHRMCHLWHFRDFSQLGLFSTPGRSDWPRIASLQTKQSPMWGLRCSDEANVSKYLFCIAKTNMKTSRYIIIKSRQYCTLSLTPLVTNEQLRSETKWNYCRVQQSLLSLI